MRTVLINLFLLLMTTAQAQLKIQIFDTDRKTVSEGSVFVNDVELSYRLSQQYWESDVIVFPPYSLKIRAEGFVPLELESLQSLPHNLILQKTSESFYYFEGIPTACLSAANTWLLQLKNEDGINLIDENLFDIKKINARADEESEGNTNGVSGMYEITAKSNTKQSDLDNFIDDLRSNHDVVFVEPVIYDNSSEELPMAHQNMVIVRATSENQQEYEQALQTAGFNPTLLNSGNGEIRWRIDLDGIHLHQYNEQIATLIEITAAEAVETQLWGID